MYSFAVFVFGLIIGSFLNVLIERLAKEKSILGRSQCESCGTKLNWQDLLPVFSFILLKGKCRYCRKKIPMSHLWVELLTGLVFTVLYQNSTGIFWFFFSSILIVLLFADFKYFILPDKIILAGSLIFIFSLILNSFYKSSRVCSFSNCYWPSIIWGAGALGGFFLVLYLISHGRWIGFGDVKLGFLLGAVFGLYSTVNLFYLAILIGSFGAVFSLVRGKGLKTRLPLGAFLSIAALLIILFKIDLVGIILRF